VALLISLAGGLTQNTHGATSYGSATFGMYAPAGAQPIGPSFQVQGRLDVFTPGLAQNWSGYDFELAYDNSLLHVDSVAPGLCTTSGWANPSTAPHVVTGCAFQSSTATGVLENITFHCLADGTSALTLVPRGDPSATQLGTALFEVDANDFNMTLNNTAVTCGNAIPPTATNTATPTNTATVTNTPTATSTNTATPFPTNTPTATTPTATHTPRPTRTPFSGPVTLNGEWAPFSRCPIDAPDMAAVDGRDATSFCVAALSGSGSIKLGNSSSTTGSSNLQFGIHGPGAWQVVSPQGGAIVAAPVDVPGGLLGLMCPSLDPLVTTVCNSITGDATNRVTASVETAGPLTDFNFDAGLQLGVAVVTLPIKVHLENTLLGPSCYIGTDADPIVLHPKNTDMSHALLNFVRFNPDGTPNPSGPLQVVKFTGVTQGDDQFAVPGATGCGVGGLLSPAVNLKQGLPSAAGNNNIVLSDSSTYLAALYQPDQFVPEAGLVFSDYWHSAVCPCSPATATPTSTPAAPTATATPTLIPVGCAGGDTDCDGCPDLSEPNLRPPTNPLNPWDFFSVPVPALFKIVNPVGVERDSAVAAADAQAIFAYFGASAHEGTTVYDQDLNQNGTKDGIEYDRSFSGDGKTGPPDGAVAARDAQFAFTQFKMGYTC
jgi:hypothetical protein